MTSQIAVFNLECVAVASDSVATLQAGSDRRTVATADKIFELGSDHRVVAMTNGEARFAKVPLSLLISEWSRSLVGPFPAVTDYARSFVDWLTTRGDIFGSDSQNAFFAWQVQDYFLSVRRRILEALSAADSADEDWASPDVQALVDGAVWEGIDRLERCDDLLGIDAESDLQFLQESALLIREQFEYVFDDVPRTARSDARLLTEVPALILAKHETWTSDTTVALIGYGADDIFPAMQAVDFHGLVNDQVRAVWRIPLSVTLESPSLIQTFAQSEAIHTFLRAYNDDFLREAHRCIEAVFADDKLIADDPAGIWDAIGQTLAEVTAALHARLDTAFEELSQSKFVSPLHSTVELLSRSDMAQMAESLVGVQALRAASMIQTPTVGGPIDVVVISRTHGVEWVRRKEFGRSW